MENLLGLGWVLITCKDVLGFSEVKFPIRQVHAHEVASDGLSLKLALDELRLYLIDNPSERESYLPVLEVLRRVVREELRASQ